MNKVGRCDARMYRSKHTVHQIDTGISAIGAICDKTNVLHVQAYTVLCKLVETQEH